MLGDKQTPTEVRYEEHEARSKMTLGEFHAFFSREMEKAGTKKRQLRKIDAVYTAFVKMMRANPDKVPAETYLSVANSEAKLRLFRILLKDSQTPKYKASTIKSYETVVRTQLARFFQSRLEAGLKIKKLSFSDALREIRTLRSLTQSQVVVELEKLKVGISLDAYKRIESGKQWPDSSPQLEAIVKALKAEDTGLIEKCPKFALFKSQRKIKNRSSAIVNFSYVDRPDGRAPAPIDTELSLYGRFKSAKPEDIANNNLQRSIGGRHHKESATANKIDLLRRYIGFLTKISVCDETGNQIPFQSRAHLEKVNSGLGLNINQLSLKDLLSLDHLKDYREFVKCRNVEEDASPNTKSKRAGREPTGTIKNLVETMADISAPLGYLRQHKNGNKAYDQIPENQFKEEINQAFGVVNSYLASIKEITNESARLDYLRNILKAERPIFAIQDVIRGLERDIRILAPSTLSAFFKDSSTPLDVSTLSLPEEFVDLCVAQTFFAIELATPLRIGQLNKVLFEDVHRPFSKVDHYTITLHRADFKNSRNTRVHRKDSITLTLRHVDPDPRFDLDIAPILDRYFLLIRPYLLLNWKGKAAPDRQDHLFVKPLDRSILSDAAECYGPMRFTPHCCRHILATDVIRYTFEIRNLDGFEEAAQILLDSRRTVEKTYAEFGPENYQTHRHTGIENHRKRMQSGASAPQAPLATKSKGSGTRADKAEINANSEWLEMDENDLVEYLTYAGYDHQRIGRLKIMVRFMKQRRRKRTA